MSRPNAILLAIASGFAALEVVSGYAPPYGLFHDEYPRCSRPIKLHLLGRLEWERFAEEVIAIVEALPARERARAVILASHWVEASTIEYLGRERGLPPVVSPHSAYWFWRADAAGRDVAIAIDIERSVLERYFDETVRLGIFLCEYCSNARDDAPILIARRPVRPLEALIGEWKRFGSGAALRE